MQPPVRVQGNSGEIVVQKEVTVAPKDNAAIVEAIVAAEMTPQAVRGVSDARAAVHVKG